MQQAWRKAYHCSYMVLFSNPLIQSFSQSIVMGKGLGNPRGTRVRVRRVRVRVQILRPSENPYPL